MKHIITILLTFLAISLSAQEQEKEVTQFMGIPVDGTKSEMIQKLKAKGYKYNNTYDCLEGQFNGENVMILVQTNNNKVWRIAIIQKDNRNETQIRIDFNNLLYQFNENDKYAPNPENIPIPQSEDISYEMLVHNKRYEASFLQKIENFDIPFEFGKKFVWFMINYANYDKYNIVIYYENRYNMSNGEDL